MDCAPYSTERVVQITGSTKQITNCVAAMYETMEGVRKLTGPFSFISMLQKSLATIIAPMSDTLAATSDMQTPSES